MAAPAYPPIKACDELVGSPKYQVMTSHMMAPIRPHISTESCHFVSISLMLTRSPPMVFATRVPKIKKATKLKNAAQMTATPGDRTRVETTVAIEFAASCQPFTKSKTSATAIISTTNAIAVVISHCLRLLECFATSVIRSAGSRARLATYHRVVDPMKRHQG